MGSYVPATALSGTAQSGPSALVVGGDRVAWPQAGAAGYWYVVVDLTDGLRPVANEFSADADAPPPEIARHLGNADHFLFFVAQSVTGDRLPRGELARFLADAGSGTALATMEQTVAQLGGDTFPNLSYALGATLNDQDLPGFEASSLWGPSVLTMQFMPLDVGGRTIYAPIQMGTAASPTMVRSIQTAPLGL
jgi:hypothetical protein